MLVTWALVLLHLKRWKNKVFLCLGIEKQYWREQGQHEEASSSSSIQWDHNCCRSDFFVNLDRALWLNWLTVHALRSVIFDLFVFRILLCIVAALKSWEFYLVLVGWNGMGQIKWHVWKKQKEVEKDGGRDMIWEWRKWFVVKDR